MRKGGHDARSGEGHVGLEQKYVIGKIGRGTKEEIRGTYAILSLVRRFGPMERTRPRTAALAVAYSGTTGNGYLEERLVSKSFDITLSEGISGEVPLEALWLVGTASDRGKWGDVQSRGR